MAAAVCWRPPWRRHFRCHPTRLISAWATLGCLPVRSRAAAARPQRWCPPRSSPPIAFGRIATPDLARSQVEGAIIQGIGYALYESRELDPSSGQVLTIGLEDYRIPGIADTPEIDIHFADPGFAHVLGGSVGLGEIATVPVAAAIANAVCHATGVRPHALPLRPDRMLAMLNTGAVS